MKKLTVLLFVFIVYQIGYSQIDPKGKGTFRKIDISVKSGITHKKATIYSHHLWPENNLRDTVHYEMDEYDTVFVSLSLIEQMSHIHNFEFDVQFIYGIPIIDTSYSYEYNGDNFISRAVIADTACFTFCYDGKGVKSHYVKLTKKQKEITPEETIYSRVSVYPNPATDELNIEFKSEMESAFSLINSAGRIIHQWNQMGTGKMDLSDLENGIYLLHVSNLKESYTIKFNVISN